MGADTPKIGSLFSGYGGLDLAAELFFGAETIWHAEIDKHASAVLAANWPTTPNLGDISTVDWSTVPPIDILTGGFPCQDISQAGKGAGIKEGTRSGLWFRMHDAVCRLRPRLVLVENVSRLRSRGLDIVLGQMAEVGYDGCWVSLRASDVGAPHRRDRLFLTFYPQGSADSAGAGLEGATERQVQHVVTPPHGQGTSADARRSGLEGSWTAGTTTDGDQEAPAESDPRSHVGHLLGRRVPLGAHHRPTRTTTDRPRSG